MTAMAEGGRQSAQEVRRTPAVGGGESLAVHKGWSRQLCIMGVRRPLSVVYTRLCGLVLCACVEARG